MEVDNYFDDYYCKEDMIKIMEKIPNKIKISLKKGKNKENSWEDDNKLSLLINDCIILENHIKLINNMNQIVKKFNDNNSKIHLNLCEDKLNDFLKEIEELGEITRTNFKLKKISNHSEEINLMLKGENNIILTKTKKNNNINFGGGIFGNQNPNCWSGVIFENPLDENIIYNFKIKIIKSNNREILVGIVPIDFDISKKNVINNDDILYFYFYNSSFRSTFPDNGVFGYNQINNKVESEAIINLNIKERKITFIIDNIYEKSSDINLSLNKPLTLAIFLYDNNDSVQIIEW